MFSSKKLSWKIALVAVIVALIVGGTVAFYFEVRVISLIGKNSAMTMQYKTDAAAKECDTVFREAFYRVGELRNRAESSFEIDEYKKDPENYFDTAVSAAMDNLVYNIVKNSGHIATAYFAVHPDLSGSPLVREVYFEKDGNGGIVGGEPQTYEEYMRADAEDMAWFYGAYNSGGPYWTGIHEFEGELMVSYVEPVIINGVKAGVVGADIFVDHIVDTVNDIKVYDTGFAVLEDNHNKFVESNDYFNSLDAAEKGKLANLPHLDHGEVFELSLGESRYMATHSGLINDYYIYLLAPKSEYNAETSVSVLRFAIIFPVVLVVVTVSCFYIGKSMGKPLITAAESLNTAINDINAAAVQFSQIASNLSDSDYEQAAFIEETSAKMNETAAMAQQNTENTFRAKELAQGTGQIIKDTLANANEMIRSMSELNKSSEEITKIIGIINHISFQINILALNASVEAVRAGSAGNGFSVVADEVRNLSQQSSATANNTETIITNNKTLTEENAENTNAVSRTLSEVGENAKKVVDLLNEISIASNEQLNGIRQINTALTEVEKTTQSNAAAAEETSAAAERLKDLTDVLREANAAINTVIYGASKIEALEN